MAEEVGAPRVCLRGAARGIPAAVGAAVGGLAAWGRGGDLERLLARLGSGIEGAGTRGDGGTEWTSSINKANKTALLSWVRETGIDLVQVNGQRRYGGPPPGWVGSPPPPGSEVFITKLPRDLYENTLIPLFQSVGQLYEFRLMLTFSGLNRGFAYAKYSDQHGARMAIATLNNWEVQKGHTILVYQSFEKCKLRVDGLPATLRRRELRALLLEATEGLLGFTLHASPGHKQGKFAVLAYSSHRAAAMAKKTLMEGKVSLFKKKVKVEWLKPELKEQLQMCGEKLPPSSVQRLESPKQMLPSSELCGALGLLGALCQRQHLGPPCFLTRCVQAEPDGWQQYWGQVVIPSCPMPCSTFLWLREDVPSIEGHEKIKEAVARLALLMLGC
ncbi:dead end protein homolog 1 [Cyrtonyx montezumae]|uniref:dead end protein homolog 1 n=1 Tax=Cyrtonyx montezumae TaxID=9017 RepID=UPI0032DBB24B